MRRTPLLSAVVWSSVSALSMLPAVGCGDDTSFTDAAVADAPIDSAVITPDAAVDAGAGVASFPAGVTLEAVCGVAVPDTVDVTVTNTGPGPLTIVTAAADRGFAVTTATPLTIAPGASAALAVRPPLSVIGTDIGGTTKLGTLSFVTSETGAPTRTVALTSTVAGANLTLRTSSNLATRPLTSLMMSGMSECPRAQEIFIHNTGNRAATVQTPSASVFGFGGFSPSAVVEPGDFVIQPMTAHVSGPCSGFSAIDYQATGPVCSELPVTFDAQFNITGLTSCFCS